MSQKTIKWLIDDMMGDPHYGGGFHSSLKTLNRDFIVFKDSPIKEVGNLRLEDDEDATYLVYGSLQFVEKASKRFPNVVSFGPNDNYLFSHYASHLPASIFLSEDYSYITLSFLKNKEQRKSLIKQYGDSKVFIRPNSWKKLFSGQIINLLDETEISNFFRIAGGSDSTFVVVSSVKNITNEYRFFVSKEKGVIAGSTYSAGDRTKEVSEWPKEAEEKALEVMSAFGDNSPDSFIVIDIAKNTDDEYKLVEINCVSCSGAYDSNTDAIIKESERIILDEINIS